MSRNKIPNFKFQISNSSAFTLIELLIVISIIGILSAIGILALSTVAQNGRDAKRIADLRTVQGSLEQYYADQGSYPVDISFGEKLASPTDPTKVYYNKLPKDPSGDVSYSYKAFKRDDSICSSTECSTYCLYATLENTDNSCTELNSFSGSIEDCQQLSNTSPVCNSADSGNFALTPP